MTIGTNTLSLTRPSAPEKKYGNNAWQFNVGLLMGVAGVMLLMVLFIVTAVVAGWVSDQDPADVGRIAAYQAWLLPAATASVALIKVGIAVVLFGIVRKLWVRVASLKESLPALITPGSGSSS